jgi:hypothetical protein
VPIVGEDRRPTPLRETGRKPGSPLQHIKVLGMISPLLQAVPAFLLERKKPRDAEVIPGVRAIKSCVVLS